MNHNIIPIYRPGNDITCKAAAPITAGTFVDLDGGLDGGLAAIIRAARIILQIPTTGTGPIPLMTTPRGRT